VLAMPIDLLREHKSWLSAHEFSVGMPIFKRYDDSGQEETNWHENGRNRARGHKRHAPVRQ
jgi:hypothetical protein